MPAGYLGRPVQAPKRAQREIREVVDPAPALIRADRAGLIQPDVANDLVTLRDKNGLSRLYYGVQVPWSSLVELSVMSNRHPGVEACKQFITASAY